jgi:hypothetical protein
MTKKGLNIILTILISLLILSCQDYGYITKNDIYDLHISCREQNNTYKFIVFLNVKIENIRDYYCYINRYYVHGKKPFYDRVSCKMQKYEIEDDFNDYPYIEFEIMIRKENTNFYKTIDKFTFERSFCIAKEDNSNYTKKKLSEIEMFLNDTGAVLEKNKKEE